jgi:hypothetical protein
MQKFHFLEFTYKPIHSLVAYIYFFCFLDKLLFPLRLYSPIWASAASMKLSVSVQLLDLGQSAGLLGRVISSSQGLYLYINTEKRTHKHETSMTEAGFKPKIILCCSCCLFGAGLLSQHLPGQSSD